MRFVFMPRMEKSRCAFVLELVYACYAVSLYVLVYFSFIILPSRPESLVC